MAEEILKSGDEEKSDSWYDELFSFVGKASDVYGDILNAQAEAEVTTTTAQQQAEVAKNLSDDTIQIGDMTISVTKTLLSIIAIGGVAILIKYLGKK